MDQDWLASPWFLPAAFGAGAVLVAFAVLVLVTPVYKHLVCLKYLFSGWKAVVPLVSALPAALGVFLLIVVFAIMNGFMSETREMTRGTLADIIVDAHLEGMAHYDEFIRRIEALDGIEAATPVIQTYAIARVEPTRVALKPIVQPCMVIGIRPADKVKMGRFHDYLRRQEGEGFPAATLLDVPAEILKLREQAGLGERPGIIAGIGVVGAPIQMTVPEKVRQGTALRVLLWFLASLALVVTLFVWQASRRRHGRTGWAVATACAATLTVGLAAWATVLMCLPMPVESVPRKQVIDFPLIDYWDDLVVSTIPVRASGAVDVGPGGVPRVSARKFTLVDIFKSGFWESDSSHLYVGFDVAQEMAGMAARPAEEGRDAQPARASQIQVRIAPGADGKALCQAILDEWQRLQAERNDGLLSQLTVKTWEDQQHMILTVVMIERNITTLMLGLMFLGFAILTALISYVMAYIKQRDVGILKAIGARDAGVGSLFLGYGFIIGLIGTGVGLVAALLMIKYLDSIEAWVNETFDVNVFPREMYYFEHIPRNLSAEWCILVCLAVLALATLASMAGGLLAALKQPVEALRYE